MAAGPDGRRGTKWPFQKRIRAPGHRGSRRNRRTEGRSGREILSSRHRRLARKRGAARGSRRGGRNREGGHNRLHPWDFGVRAPQRANWKSPIVDRRTSVNRSSCGRRTSPRGGLKVSCLVEKYTPCRPVIPCFCELIDNGGLNSRCGGAVRAGLRQHGYGTLRSEKELFLCVFPVCFAVSF
jgi:hypothetical protein